MKVLLLGSGGREHALAWKISQSNKLKKLFIAPGNAGTSTFGKNINIDSNNFSSVKQIVREKNINLVVVGPENPLVNGIQDFFIEDAELKNIPIIGPSKIGAQLEGSKEFAKKFMLRHNIPTAKYLSVSLESIDDGLSFLKQLSPPYVLKADGLAAGKGVLILNTLSEANQALNEMLNGQFGEASKRVVIEEFLTGIEVSFFAITDGNSYKILPEAKDYKKIGENDTGLNTGGMGAISPVAFANNKFKDKVEKQIIIPTIKGLKKDKIYYKGFLFFGLMNVNGNPFVIEYNVRLGDPETEAITGHPVPGGPSPRILSAPSSEASSPARFRTLATRRPEFSSAMPKRA
jgi:phosphoribosylamine--glycine ligase